MAKLKVGQLVEVMGRVARVRRLHGYGSRVWTSGEERGRPSAEQPTRVHTEPRVLLELVGGTDPPAGYTAWFHVRDITIPDELQLPLF